LPRKSNKYNKTAFLNLGTKKYPKNCVDEAGNSTEELYLCSEKGKHAQSHLSSTATFACLHRSILANTADNDKAG